MSMSIPYDQTGRTGQKARTREAMLDATSELLAEGVTPTVEQAAMRAGVSRTTAYRYFANQRDLLIATHPEIDQPSLLGDDPPADVESRFERFMDVFTGFVLEYENEQRATLRLSLDQSMPAGETLPLRGGRAIDWIEDVLAPVRDRMPPADRRRFALAARATLGIESLVWLTDVAGLTPQEAVELMRASARTLFRAALDAL